MQNRLGDEYHKCRVGVKHPNGGGGIGGLNIVGEVAPSLIPSIDP